MASVTCSETHAAVLKCYVGAGPVTRECGAYAARVHMPGADAWRGPLLHTPETSQVIYSKFCNTALQCICPALFKQLTCWQLWLITQTVCWA